MNAVLQFLIGSSVPDCYKKKMMVMQMCQGAANGPKQRLYFLLVLRKLPVSFLSPWAKFCDIILLIEQHNLVLQSNRYICAYMYIYIHIHVCVCLYMDTLLLLLQQQKCEIACTSEMFLGKYLQMSNWEEPNTLHS